MKLSIVNIKKSQINASKDASAATIEAPAKDYSGVPEAEAQAEAVKEQKKAATTKARAERKVSAKKTDKAKAKSIKQKAEVKEVTKPKVVKPMAKKEKEPTKKTTPKYMVMDYSEKCVALFGDTKPIKDELKQMGGRFNANLRPFASEDRVPGWVFPKKCKDDLMKLIK